MTTLELIVTVQDMISESTYERFPKAEIIRWLNRGLEDIAVKTGYLTWKWLVSTTADKREYPYPDTAKSLYRLEYDGKPLPPTDFPVLDKALEEWQAATGPPENYYHSWNRAFGIYPTPDNTYSVYLYGFDRGATLSDDDDVPLIPDHFHRAPALFAAYNIKRADNDLPTFGSLRNEYQNVATRRGVIYDMIKEKEDVGKRGIGHKVGYTRSTVEDG